MFLFSVSTGSLFLYLHLFTKVEISRLSYKPNKALGIPSFCADIKTSECNEAEKGESNATSWPEKVTN